VPISWLLIDIEAFKKLKFPDDSHYTCIHSSSFDDINL